MLPVVDDFLNSAFVLPKLLSTLPAGIVGSVHVDNKYVKLQLKENIHHCTTNSVYNTPAKHTVNICLGWTELLRNHTTPLIRPSIICTAGTDSSKIPCKLRASSLEGTWVLGQNNQQQYKDRNKL